MGNGEIKKNYVLLPNLRKTSKVLGKKYKPTRYKEVEMAVLQ